MDVFARKKSLDPLQESLRQRKDKWNLAAKELISRIIAFKRALNGRGDGHYNLPTSNIKDPFPPEIISFLSTLSSNFEQLAAEALKIQQEQANYSKNRKKPQPKVATASTKKAKLKIGSHEVETIVAITAEEQEKGLMNKPWPPPIMSFIYSSPQVNRFWMHQTPSPLDIVFSLKGKITAIHKGEPHSTKLIGDYEPSDLVVEFPFGTCAQMKIGIGDPIELLNNSK